MLFSCGKKTIIEGVVSNADSSKLVLENFNAGTPIALGEKSLDEDGKFRFNVPALDTTEIYNLVLDSSRIIRLVVKPEEKISIKTDKKTFGKNYAVSGSEESELLQEAEMRLATTRAELKKLRKQYTEAKNDDEREQISKSFDTKLSEHYEYLRHFVFDNAPSLVSYLALFQKIDAETFVFNDLNDDKYVRAVAQRMKTEYPNSPYLPLLIKELDRRTVQKQNARIAQMVEVAKNSFPDLNLKNAEGKERSLKNVNAKYVLLWFGVLNEASKNHLLPIYTKYHNRGLEIYFVDENPNEQVWRQAVEDLNTPWINVRDNGLASKIYNVNKLPANYILEVEGTIEGKDLFNAYLPEKLEKLL